MFARVTAENLFSWGSLDYEVLSGLCLIDGFNHDDNTSEGSGKSAIPNILAWTVYGQIPKNANIDDVVKDGAKYGVGIVETLSGHKIVRARRPNDLRIINPDGTETVGKDARETQKLIESLVGMSFDTFCQGVYFAQNYPEKFITANEANKAKILSEIQDLSIYDRARKAAGEKEKLAIDQRRTLDYKVSNKMTALMESRESLARITSIVDGFYEKQKQQTKDINIKIQTLDVKIANLNELTSNTNTKELDGEIAQISEMSEVLRQQLYAIELAKGDISRTAKEKLTLETQFTKNASLMNDYQQELNELESSEGKCPTCGGPFKQDEHKKKLATKVKLLKDRIDTAVKERDSIIAELSVLKSSKSKEFSPKEEEELKKEYAEVVSIHKDLEQKKIQLGFSKRDLDNALKNKADLELSKEQLLETKPDKELGIIKDLKVKIEDLELDVKELTAQIEQYASQAAIYDALKTEFKDIKSFVFSNLLEEISNKSTGLAADLFEVPVSIKFFNEGEDGEVSKIQTQVILDGAVRPLGLLSGGQFRRVQLSVDLALSSIIASRGAKACNFRILDEPFKDLSLQSMEKMVSLLEGLKGTTILIEHSPLIKSIVNNTFFVNYRNGESKHDA